MKFVTFIVIAFAVSKLGGSAPTVQNAERCRPVTLIKWDDMIFEGNDKFLEEIRKRASENRVLRSELQQIARPRQLTRNAGISLNTFKASTDVIKSEALKTESSAIDLNEKTLQLLDEMRKSNIDLGEFEQKIKDYKLMAAKDIKQAESSKRTVLKSHEVADYEKAQLDEFLKEMDALNPDYDKKERVFTERFHEIKTMIKRWEAIDKCRKRHNRTH